MPDRPALDVAAMHAALDERWARLEVVEQTASTNADLLADERAPDRSVLAAEYQAGGRGRLDRTWESPPRAGLTVSVLLRPAVPLAQWGWLPLLAGVALAEAVGAVADVAVALKWPNDLLLAPAGSSDFAKAAGILAQTHHDAVVVGIGVNVSSTAGELPPTGATSLALCGADVDRTDLAIALLQRLDARVAQWADVDGDAEACGLAAAYGSVCATVGQAVRVGGTDGTAVEGMAVGVDGYGRLLVDDRSTVHVLAAGDVVHVRRS